MLDRTGEVAALFDGARLTLARHLAGLRKSELAGLVGKSATAVAAWESGAKRPTAAAVAQLALALAVEPGFFAMRPDDVARLSSPPHFRSLRSTSQLARDQAFAYGQMAVDIASSMERHVEFPVIDMPSFPVPFDDVDSDEPERAARRVRERWGLETKPAGHLVRLLENHGVLVVFSPPQAASVDAYSFDSHLRPVVVLNPIKRDYYRQRFDVAHELGHLIMHSDAEPGGRIVEDQAHRFAGELLMPAEQIRPLLPTAMGSGAWRTLARLKEQWGVSMQALLYRARWLGQLSDVSYRNAMATISARGWRREEPGLVEAIEQPSLLARAVELLGHEGIDEESLRAQCRVPIGLFRTVTSRVPDPAPPADDGPRRGQVVSLLAHQGTAGFASGRRRRLDVPLKITHDDVAAFAARAVNLQRDTANERRRQVNTLRDRLATHIADNPGFSLVKMLHAGSVAKGTALRTFNDFDVAIYVKRDDAPVEETVLVEWTADRLREAYRGVLDPSQITPSTHCVNVHFKSTGTDVDVVPVLYEGDPDDRGYLIAKDSVDRTDWLLTSVRLHLDFVRDRRNACKDDWAQVVRLVKWWVREQRMHTPGDEFRFKSFMVELLCAHLLDTSRIDFTDYVAALDGFFDYVARTGLKERIAFDDYYAASALPSERVGEIEIFDPVNPKNNTARQYEEQDRVRIVDAAAAASDAITEASCATTKDQAVDCWRVVFGRGFRG